MTSLSDKALTLFSDTFADYKSPISEQHREAVAAFLQTLELGLTESLPPKYHLLSLDPGMGKTTACVCFIKAWREAGFKPEGSVLIGISTLQELQSFISETGLPPSEFGVLTSDDELNGLGLLEDEHGTAKVLFTTQPMIRSRTKAKTFAEATEFHFQGSPRSLRLWDETILPSDGVVIRRDLLLTFPRDLRSRFAEFSQALERFTGDLASHTVNARMEVPHSLSMTQRQTRQIAQVLLGEEAKKTFEDLQLMVGREMLVQQDNRSGELLLVGTKPTLPEDFAPVVVSDASGRVRGTYRLWDKHKNDLVILPGAQNSFHKLNVHLWSRSCGKGSLIQRAVQQDIAEAIVEAFNRDPEGRWLVITYKDTLSALKEAVAAMIPSVPGDRIEWINWGRHHSTNAFRDAENVVIVGQNTYRPADYLALTFAASGLPIGPESLSDMTEIRLGENRHHLLQAICRGSVRKASGGSAGRCNAYIISPQGNAETFLEDIFPGHSLSIWREPEAPATGKLAEAIAFLRAEFAVNETASVTKKALRDTLGIKHAPSLRQNVLSKPHFHRFLAENWLVDEDKRIRRVVCEFDLLND